MHSCQELSNVILESACLVCGAMSSGNHYGCRSCASCKLFFRRAFLDCVEPKCRRTPHCADDAMVNEMCRSCRYSKCLRMGMDKSGRTSTAPSANKWKFAAVRPPRDPVGRRKRVELGNQPYESKYSPIGTMQINDKFNMLELIAQLSFYDKTTRERKMARFKQDFEVYEVRCKDSVQQQGFRRCGSVPGISG